MSTDTPLLNDLTPADFRAQLVRLVGEVISIRLWPYRYEGILFLALDVDGRADSLAMTITVGERLVLERPCAPSIDLEAGSFAQALEFALDTVQALTGQRGNVMTWKIQAVPSQDNEWPVSIMFLAGPAGIVQFWDRFCDSLSDMHEELIEHVGHPHDIHCELVGNEQNPTESSIRLIVSGDAGRAWLRLYDQGCVTYSWGDGDKEYWCLPGMRDGVDLFYAVSVLARLLSGSADYQFPELIDPKGLISS